MSIIFHGIGNNGSPYIKDLEILGQKIIITYNDSSTKSIIPYEHPNTPGNKHIPSGGSSGQILRWSTDGTAVWGEDNDTTYSTGTTDYSGITKLYTETGDATDGTMTQSAITTALNGKSETGHTHNYAGSSTVGGSALSAIKLDANTAGSEVQPVYFDNGQPVAITYTLEKSVPSDAKFTDTTYSVFKGATNSVIGESGLVPVPKVENVEQFLRGDGIWATPTDTKYIHPNSGVIEGTYHCVTVDVTGHVTIGSNPTTLSGYGIIDAAAKIHTHTVSQISDFPTSLPASDVYAWAKSENKPIYSWSEITDKPSTFAPSSHTHNYAGSASAGGAANSADKLTTARNITIGNTTKSIDGSKDVTWTLSEIGIGSQDDIQPCYTMIGGTSLSSSATTTDSAAQYKVISKSTASTGDIFSKSLTLPKGLYSVMVRMKVSAITSTSNIFKLTIVDGSTTTTKYIKPSMFNATNSYTTLGTAVENTSGTLKVTLSVSTALSSQTVCVDYLAITPAMVGVTSIA